MTRQPHDGRDGGIGLLLGSSDEMRAEVFVRWTAPPQAGSGARISGSLTGPQRRRDAILPVTVRLAPVPVPADAPLARAILTEPAYWTPDLPNLYRLRAEVTRDGVQVATVDRLIGLRRLGVRGRSFWLDGRRWVPRAGVASPVIDVAACKSSGTAVATARIDEAACLEADETGVAIIALLGGSLVGDAASACERIATLADHPSVVMAVAPGAAPAADVAAMAAAARRVKGTTLIGHEVDGLACPPEALPAGVDFLLVTMPAGLLPHAAWRDAAPPIPLIAWRQWGDDAALPRPACDRLQAALAAWGIAAGAARLPWDWAGYVVGPAPEVR